MFNFLTNKLSNTFNNLIGQTINEKNIENTLQEIRSNLIDSDVSISAIEIIIQNIKDKLIGIKVLKNLKASDMIIKACNDTFVTLLSSNSEESTLNLEKKPSIIMMIGLQGSGKTTTSAKLAHKLKSEGKKVLLASIDTYRFAAQKQLEILAQDNQIDSLPIHEEENALQIIKRVKNAACNFDVVIIDTAGRLQTDQTMLQELVETKSMINPHETILVLDSMMGQDATNVMQEFHKHIHITGLIFTKIDSDTKGGALLSVKAHANQPVLFLGAGEKINDLEKFYADRIADRILDKGDIVSMVEKIEENIQQKEAEEIFKKIQEGNFDLHDFAKQIKMMSKIGGLKKMMAYLPGFNQYKNTLENNVNDDIMQKHLILISSMTSHEKSFPEILAQPKRQQRIAKGAGSTIYDLQKLLQQFNKLQKTMAKIKNMGNAMTGLPGINNLNDLKNLKYDDLKNIDIEKIKKMLGH